MAEDDSASGLHLPGMDMAAVRSVSPQSTKPEPAAGAKIDAPNGALQLAELQQAGLALDDRLAAIIGEAPEQDLSAITDAAARLLDCPIALVSIVEPERQWFKASTGLDCAQVPAEQSFCAHAMAQECLFVVPDAAADPRFRANPLVTGERHFRFYAGMPIAVALSEGEPPRAVGALCVIDRHARFPDAAGMALIRQILTGLARVVETLIQSRIDATRADEAAFALRQALMARDRLNRQFRQAERLLGVGSWRLRLADQSVEWSEQVYAIHEVPPDRSEVLQDALRFYPPPDRARLEDAIAHTVATGEPYDLEIDFITAQGRSRRVRAVGELEREGGEPVALIGVFQDVTARYELQQALQRQLNTDELTRIASRHHFNQVLAQQLQRCQADGSELALALIDLDHFKAVNDTRGHAAGDNILRRAALALTQPWLEGSFAARLGGDEFVLVVTDPTLVGDFASVLRRLLGQLVMAEADQSGGAVTATIGACLAHDVGFDRGQLLARADQALYAAKARARGTAMLARQNRMQAIAADQANAEL